MYALRKFFVNADAYLVTPDGFRVPGYNDSTLTHRGDLKLESAGVAAVTSFRFETNGLIRLHREDGTSWSPYTDWIRASGYTTGFTLPPMTNGAPYLFRVEASP